MLFTSVVWNAKKIRTQKGWGVIEAVGIFTIENGFDIELNAQWK